VSVIVSVHKEPSGALALNGDPEIVSRGWVAGDNGDRIHKKAVETVRDALVKEMKSGESTPESIIKVAKRSLGKYINAETRQKPMVVPVILGLD